jgi:transposase
MARKKTKAYSKAFRKQAVKLADQPDRTAADVARDLGIHSGQIYNWRTQFNKFSKGQFTVADGTNYSVAEKAEIRKLKKEIANLKEERDFLKKQRRTSKKTTSKVRLN